MKNIRYLLEAALVWIAFFVFRMMPYEKASDLGGWIGRTIGPRLAASRKAYKNLHRALPGRTQGDYDGIVRDMWENLGRVIAEYPHLKEIIRDADVTGIEYLNKIGTDERFVMIGAHLANWEIIPYFLNYRSEYPTTYIYREPNNPYVAKLLEKCRNPENKIRYVPKSSAGSRDLVKAIKEGKSIGILFDQKYNQGLSVNFFGHPAMTSPSFATLARKYDCPVVPIWIERVQGAKFRVVVEQPFTVDGRSDEDMIAYAHSLLEEEILKNPGHWLWLHRRWIT